MKRQVSLMRGSHAVPRQTWRSCWRPMLPGRRPMCASRPTVGMALRPNTMWSANYGRRALNATDASNDRQLPIGVVLPRGVEDVIQTVALCRRYAVPLLPRGGGTGLAGQTCNTAVIIDMSKYMRAILEIDPGQKIA